MIALLPLMIRYLIGRAQSRVAVSMYEHVEGMCSSHRKGPMCKSGLGGSGDDDDDDDDDDVMMRLTRSR